MFAFIENLIHQAGAIGVAGFALGGVVEELFLPFPTPLLLVGAGYFVGEPMSPMLITKMIGLVIMPIALGATFGSLVIYGLCYKGGKVVIDRFSKWLRFTWADVEKVRAKLNAAHSDEWVLFLTRAVPFGPTKLFNAAAGVVRMDVYKFTLIVFVATLIRITMLFTGALLLDHAIFN